MRKRSHGEDAGGSKHASGLALLVGSVMDNIPENMALGISLVTGGSKTCQFLFSFCSIVDAAAFLVFSRYATVIAKLP